MQKKENNRATTVKIYHGYGHQHNLVVYGHVLAKKIKTRSSYSNNVMYNIFHLIQLFLVEPVPNVNVTLLWDDQQIVTTTEADGFFKFEWQSINVVTAGWHKVVVNVLNKSEQIIATGEGEIFVPHSTQYAFISDIDDTILVSHSTTTHKRLKTLFTKNPRSRKAFAEVVTYYHLLALSHTEPNVPNPFFYVSSSEWNLYNDLNDFFTHNGLPKGAFLLNAIKRWYQLLKTGHTMHLGKLTRIIRILEAFPRQKFVLLGDNSQSDPGIYVTIANKYPDKITAIYIRNGSEKKELITKNLLSSINNKNIHTCLFKHTNEAIEHSKSIGIIE